MYKLSNMEMLHYQWTAAILTILYIYTVLSLHYAVQHQLWLMLLATRPSSPLPAAGTSSFAPGHSKLLTVCFVARRYGDRAPGRAAMDIIFAQNKKTATPGETGTTLRLRNLPCSSLVCLTRNTHHQHNVPRWSDRGVPVVFFLVNHVIIQLYFVNTHQNYSWYVLCRYGIY